MPVHALEDPVSAEREVGTRRSTCSGGPAEPLVNFKVMSGKAKDTRVQELLRTVGLNPYFNNRYPHEFSGGPPATSPSRCAPGSR